MRIIKLNDEMSDYDLGNLNRTRPLDTSIELLVYSYHSESYDGYGVAAYLDNKGLWHLDDLGHCSCYGALDGGFNRIGYSKPDLVELLGKRAESSWNVEDYLSILREVEAYDRSPTAN